MRAGLLNKIIKFKKPIIQKNEFGEEIETFEDFITTRARVVFKGENRELSNNELFYSSTLEFTIRSYHQVNENMIIECNFKDYRILSIDDTIQSQKTIIGELIND
ncbi:MAG: head-tail adaptor protein [Clostridia bacterium]|nr:head-tail adaptor protein [Clostridia bacterium]